MFFTSHGKIVEVEYSKAVLQWEVCTGVHTVLSAPASIETVTFWVRDEVIPSLYDKEKVRFN